MIEDVDGYRILKFAGSLHLYGVSSMGQGAKTKNFLIFKQLI